MSGIRIERLLPDGFLADSLRADARRAHRHAEGAAPWFYDERGSELFDKITLLDEHYPTRAERSILRAVPRSPRRPARTLAELGSGSAGQDPAAARRPARGRSLRSYVQVDVSEAARIAASPGLLASYPGLELHAVVSDFEERLGLPAGGSPKLVAFLGGTIGNLLPEQRAAFLASVRARLSDGDALLLGTDLVKDPAVLVAAYDDDAGVTAAFNKNILSVLNASLGARFDLDEFEHVALWDPDREWIEMRLRSVHDQQVEVPALDLTSLPRWRCELRYRPSSAARAWASRRGCLAMRSWWMTRRAVRLVAVRA
jgi:L-histidine N-alpha-methyltransferase